ncbi:hypothetical protein PsYK624_122180 [Phanerochaete sordida]|uniref:Uncharacterized protein n=1 Tax=Phanerochaete sordida TaxID=48140 RepID=A0A9P3LI57_9APHY|nr:hypothetical protein PsYK624_122180 [Phanerochaete sordida]
MAFGLGTLTSALSLSIPRPSLRSRQRRKSYASASDATVAPPLAEVLHAELAEAHKQIDALTERLAAREKELQDARGHAEDLAARESEAALDLAALRTAHDALHGDHALAVQKYRGMKAELATAEEAVRREREARLAEWTGHHATRTAYARLRGQAAENARELAHLRAAHADVKALLDIREAELHEAQAVQNEADAVSCADVQRQVESLNSEVLQLAVLVTDSMAFESRSSAAPRAADASLQPSSWIGPTLTSFLASSDHAQNPVWVRTALQASILRFASDVIESWGVHLDPPENRVLTSIHAKLFQDEPYAISARWRVLTRRSVAAAGPSDPLRRVSEELLKCFKDVLSAAGVRHDAPSTDWTSVRGRVESIAAAIVALQKTIGEDATSNDFCVVCPVEGAHFVSDTMEDLDGRDRNRRGSASQRPQVLCTTALGLYRREKAKEGEGDAGTRRTVVVKAGVVLQNVVEDTPGNVDIAE